MNTLDKNLKFIGIGLAILFFGFFAINYAEGHYYDKGYRLCINAVDSKQSYGNTIQQCVSLYAGIIDETK